MKKSVKLAVLMIVLALTLVMTVACGGTVKTGGSNDTSSGNSGAAVGNNTPDNDDPCDCCPDCIQDNCEYECEECECCIGGGGAGDGKGPLTFKVAHKTHYYETDAYAHQDITTSGEAIVTADQVDETGNYGSAEGEGRYDNWQTRGWFLKDYDFDFTAQLSNYDPLSGKSILVSFDRFEGENNAIETEKTSSVNPMTGISFNVNLFFMGVLRDYYDEDTGFWNFELPMNNWKAEQTFNWEGDDVIMVSSVKVDCTISVTPVN